MKQGLIDPEHEQEDHWNRMETMWESVCDDDNSLFILQKADRREIPLFSPIEFYIHAGCEKVRKNTKHWLNYNTNLQGWEQIHNLWMHSVSIRKCSDNYSLKMETNQTMLLSRPTCCSKLVSVTTSRGELDQTLNDLDSNHHKLKCSQV